MMNKLEQSIGITAEIIINYHSHSWRSSILRIQNIRGLQRSCQKDQNKNNSLHIGEKFSFHYDTPSTLIFETLQDTCE